MTMLLMQTGWIHCSQSCKFKNKVD